MFNIFVILSEFEDFPLSTSQIRTLFDKINAIDISFTESEVHDLETHDSADVWKLFYIVDKFTGLLQKIKSEAQERQSLQSKLENQVLENEYLKEEVAGHVRDKQESERQRNELVLGLEDIIQKLGGDDLVGVHKVDHVTALLPILEKIVTHTRAESEIFKSKAEELSTKLLKTQKLVDDLSAKLKLLEESKPVVVNRPETVQEKGIFESSSLPANSEISEIQDPVTLDIFNFRYLQATSFDKCFAIFQPHLDVFNWIHAICLHAFIFVFFQTVNDNLVNYLFCFAYPLIYHFSLRLFCIMSMVVIVCRTPLADFYYNSS